MTLQTNPNPLLKSLEPLQLLKLKPVDPAPDGWWLNAAGHAVKLTDENIPPYVQLREQTISPLIAEWIELYLRTARLKGRLRDSVVALEEICLDQHGVKIGGEKGNVRLTQYDGSFRVERSYQKRSAYDETLRAAQILMTEYIKEKAGESSPELVEMINSLFIPSKGGQIRKDLLLRLKQFDYEDERWKKAMAIIAKAEVALDSALYFMVEVRDADGKYHSLPLNIADVRPLAESPVEGMAMAKVAQ
jgi:hypothetical protein